MRKEARVLAVLDHPNIVTLHSIEEFDGAPLLTMAYVDGKNLGEWIGPDGMPTDRIIETATGIADGLRCAHEQGVTHRDLKPSNIMIDGSGRPRILDFGLAHMEAVGPERSRTQSGAVMGTFPFMSPEQVEGRRADARSDIFSLGVVLYRMATGRQPFEGATTAALVSSILRDTPPSIQASHPHHPAELNDVIQRCLQKDPASRYASAAALQAALRAVPPTSAPPPTWPRIGRAMLVALGLAVAVAVVAGLTARSSMDAPASSGVPLVAVLPFKAAGTGDSGVLAGGLHAGLLVRLGALKAFRVISRTSMLEYVDSKKNVGQVAEELGAGYVLEGSVQASDDRVRITAQLIDAAKDRPLWGEVYDRELTASDLLDVQADLTRTIAQHLRVELSEVERADMERQQTRDIVAYSAYLRGLALWDRGDDTVDARIDAFRTAVAQDPDFADAWAHLSAVYAQRIHERKVQDATASVEDDRQAALTALQRARELQPDSGAVHFAWASYLYYGVAEYRRALAVLRALEKRERLSVDAQIQKALVLRRMGHFSEAQRALRDAQVLRPRSVRLSAMLAVTATFAHDCPTADRDLHAGRELSASADVIVRATLFFHARCTGDFARIERMLADVDVVAEDLWVDQIEALMAQRKLEAALTQIDAVGDRVHDQAKLQLHVLAIDLLRVLGRSAEANARLQELESSLRDEPRWGASFPTVVMLSLRGDKAATERWLLATRRARRRGSERVRRVADLLGDAIVLVRVGLLDKALDALNAAFEAGGGMHFRDVERDPRFDILRGHTAYAALRAKYRDY